MDHAEECVICFGDTDSLEKGALLPLAASLLDSSRSRCQCSASAHIGCVREWTDRSPACPVCQVALQPYAPTPPSTRRAALRPVARSPQHRRPLVWCLAIMAAGLIIVFWSHVHTR